MRTLAMVVLILSVITLIAMLGIHSVAALFWGSWDQDGLGSTGFWHIFQDGLGKGGRAYLVAVVLLVTTTVYLNRSKHEGSRGLRSLQ